MAYNKLHGITPQSVKSTVQALIRITDSMKDHKPDDMSDEELQELMKSVEDQMLSAAKDLDFERCPTASAAHAHVPAFTSEKTAEDCFDVTRTVSSPVPSCVPPLS